MTDQISTELSARTIGDKLFAKPPSEWMSTSTPVSPTIELILSQAVQAGRTGAELKELLDVFERLNAKKAEQAFNAAFAKFKAECPPIRRRSENAQFQVTRNGVKRASRYAALEDIDADTRESLTNNGLSCAWGDAVVTGDSITMHCFVYHEAGFSRSSGVTLPHESKAGASPQQKYASTITYLQRYSLIAALGLTTCDEDDDGNEPGGPTITEEQAGHLDKLLAETGSNSTAFMKFAKVTRLLDIPASRYGELVRAIESKRKAAI
jgi:hypothetical protein